MKVFRGLQDLPVFKNPVITIGTFDGVHLGHACIIQRLLKRAHDVNGVSIIITFEPHPRLVLSSQSPPLELLSSLDEKIDSLEQMRVDYLVIVPFTLAFANIPAQSYVEDFIFNHFHPHTIIIGYDHHFGRNREGDFRLLESLSKQFKYELEEIPVQEIEHIAVSSTKIRLALHEGDIRKANELAGKKYSLEGDVIEGKRLGHTIGFPTANLMMRDTYKLIPGNGVYAVQVDWNHRSLTGMMNIGIRPSVSSEGKRSLEVHIFDFNESLYGQTIRVTFVSRMRSEHKFESLDALIHQLKQDELDARQLFANHT